MTTTTAGLLAGHDGLTAEELDFPPSLKLRRASMVNCDTRLRRGCGGQVQYRLGRDAGEEEA